MFPGWRDVHANQNKTLVVLIRSFFDFNSSVCCGVYHLMFVVVVVVVVNVNFRKGGISPGRVFKISSTDFYTFDSRNTIARCRRLKMRTSSPQIPTLV